MDRQDIHTFIKTMNGANAVAEDHANWVNSTCPLAKWLHDKGSDNSPSFGISIDPMQSKYHCFTCKSKGVLPQLVSKLERLSGKKYPELEEYTEAEEFGGLLPTWSDSDEGSTQQEVHEDMLFYYDLVADHEYLTSRGIDEAAAIRMGLRIDYADDTTDGRERILFPAYTINENFERKFMGFTGRATDDKKELRVKDYHGLPKRKVLLGIEHIRPDDEFVVLSEGLFDYAIGFSYNAPALAVMHSSATKEQAELLLNLGKPVYLMMDNDTAGESGAKAIYEMLNNYLPIFETTYPGYFEFGDGDPAVLAYDEYWEMINNARLL